VVERECFACAMGRLSLVFFVGVVGCVEAKEALPPPVAPSAVPMLSSAQITHVAIGWDDLCLLAGGRVLCKKDWSDAPAASSFVGLPVDGAVEVSIGRKHACARVVSGGLVCWGDRAGFAPEQAGVARVPEAVVGFTDVVEVRVSETATCARRADGTAWCVGLVGNAKLGDVAFPTPTRIKGVDKVGMLALGGGSLCARRLDGTVWCRGPKGQSTTLANLDHVVDLAATSAWTCARRTNGSVQCFHPDEATSVSAKPVPMAYAHEDPSLPSVGGILDAVSLVGGEGHACVLRSNGTVVCFGENDYGQLGDGTRAASGDPRPVRKLTSVVAIACGEGRTCAQRADGKVVCWGRDLLDDSMFHALTGRRAKPGPPGEHDSLAPEPLRVPSIVPMTKG